MKFRTVLFDSFRLLGRSPKLFIPKIIISFLYGISMIFMAQILLQIAPIFQNGAGIASLSSSPAGLQVLQSVVPPLLLLLVFAFAVMVLDIIVNAMYPFMVEGMFRGESISFRKALKLSLGKSLLVVPAVIFSLTVSLLITLPFIFLLSFSQLIGNNALAVVSVIFILAAAFITNIVFYLLYPVSTLERKGFFGVISRSVLLARKNIANVAKASVVQFIFSMVSFALAFFSENPQFLLLFIVFRIAVAVLATYVMVLNPVFYLEFERGHKIGAKG